MTDLASWELAGLTLQSQWPATRLPVPEQLHVDGDWVVSESLQPGGRLTAPSRDVLLRFARIQTADDVLRFARRFGVLRIREEHIGRMRREPLEEWFVRARQARALLNIASAVHQDRPTDMSDWRVAYERVDPGHVKWVEGTKVPPTPFARGLLGFMVDFWLQESGTRPSFQWTTTQPRISFSRYLPALLAVNLLIAVTRSEGLAICSTCGNPYLRQHRQPKREQQNYCPGCGRKAAWRYAARRRTRATLHRRRRSSTRVLSALERQSRLLMLAKDVGAPPHGVGAGKYWRAFHRQARARGLVNGRTPIASRMAYARAVHQEKEKRSGET